MILNESRGRDATGFFNAHGAWWKHAERATVELRDRRCTKWIEDSARKTWAVCGHTRAGTRGGATTRNAHPFQYGKVIGSHNGTIPDSPREYPVDTEWAIDLLSKAEPGHYQDALGEVAGWYALTWLDKREAALYLLNWEGSLHITLYKGVYYYSSEADHLRTAIGAETRIASISHGKVIRFHWDKKEGIKSQNMPDFTGKPRVTYQQRQTDFRQSSWRDQYPGYEDEVVTPRVMGPTVQTTRPRVVDRLLPSGFVIKFPGGLWHAQILNNTYRLLTPQKEIDEQCANAKPGDYIWMRPGEIRSKLTPLSQSTPAVPLPAGIKAPPDLAEYTRAMTETSVTTQEKKSDPEAGVTTFPTEEDQEKASLEEVKASSMDRDGSLIEKWVGVQQERLDFLTNDLDLTEAEAMSVMTQEGYFAPCYN